MQDDKQKSSIVPFIRSYWMKFPFQTPKSCKVRETLKIKKHPTVNEFETWWTQNVAAPKYDRNKGWPKISKYITVQRSSVTMCVPFCRSILKKIKKMATKQQKLKVLARGVKSGWFSFFLSMCMTIQIIFQQLEKRAVFWLESKSSDQHCFYFNVNVIILFLHQFYWFIISRCTWE